MPDIGIPHPVTTDAGVFTPADAKGDVGEPGDLGAQEGISHNLPDTTEPSVFTGTDPKADVGDPVEVT